MVPIKSNRHKTRITEMFYEVIMVTSIACNSVHNHGNSTDGRWRGKFIQRAVPRNCDIKPKFYEECKALNIENIQEINMRKKQEIYWRKKTHRKLPVQINLLLVTESDKLPMMVMAR